MIIHYAAHSVLRHARRKFSGLKIFLNFFRKCVDRFVILLYTKQVVRDETTTTRWKFSSAGRASALQAEGHRFEPCNFHHQALTKVSAFSFSLLQRDFAGRTRRVCATPYPGGEFFAEPHRGVALCGARKLPLPRRGQKGRDTCGLPVGC